MVKKIFQQWLFQHLKCINLEIFTFYKCIQGNHGYSGEMNTELVWYLNGKSGFKRISNDRFVDQCLEYRWPFKLQWEMLMVVYVTLIYHPNIRHQNVRNSDVSRFRVSGIWIPTVCIGANWLQPLNRTGELVLRPFVFWKNTMNKKASFWY